MDDDLPPPPPGTHATGDDETDDTGHDRVVYLPWVSPSKATGAGTEVTAVEALTGCVQAVGLLIKLLFLLGLLALIIWFVVVVITTPT